MSLCATQLLAHPSHVRAALPTRRCSVNGHLIRHITPTGKTPPLKRIRVWCRVCVLSAEELAIGYSEYPPGMVPGMRKRRRTRHSGCCSSRGCVYMQSGITAARSSSRRPSSSALGSWCAHTGAFPRGHAACPHVLLRVSLLLWLHTGCWGRAGAAGVCACVRGGGGEQDRAINRALITRPG